MISALDDFGLDEAGYRYISLQTVAEQELFQSAIWSPIGCAFNYG
jgi:hypothetical protein